MEKSLGIAITSAQAKIFEIDRQITSGPVYNMANITGPNCTYHDIDALEAIGEQKRPVTA